MKHLQDTKVESRLKELEPNPKLTGLTMAIAAAVAQSQMSLDVGVKRILDAIDKDAGLKPGNLSLSERVNRRRIMRTSISELVELIRKQE
jgi:hypothetical protein